MHGIEKFVPKSVEALAVEEVGWCLLSFFKNLPQIPQVSHDVFCEGNFFEALKRDYGDVAAAAIAEGWGWLWNQGYLARHLGYSAGHFNLSRKARTVNAKSDFDAMRKADLMPVQLLHPAIQKSSWAAFIRGDYETAVFAAFKQIEIAVRTAARADPADIGVKLMRKAFQPNSGPLSDRSIVEAEQQGLSDLFAGSMGYYRNPTGHRSFPINDPADAVEMMMLASHLRKIIDVRSPIGPIPT